MKIQIVSFIHRLHTSFWFLPSLMAGGAMVLSWVTVAADRTWIVPQGAGLWLIYSGTPEGARTVLSVIAGSMMTVAGVVFSITIVVLSLASSQFGPRLIRNFMNVRANQLVLGTFVATFIYAILVLHAADTVPRRGFVPCLSVTAAVTLCLASLALLIYFIHSVSESIQAGNIIARVHRDLNQAVERIFPATPEGSDPPPAPPMRREYDIPAACDSDACPVRSERSGYLQAVDSHGLKAIADQEDLLIHLDYRSGDFVTRGSALVTVWPGKRVDGSLAERINALFILGRERTLEQDAEYAVSQLVEIAVRALSPGINDPFTAITCIDWLCASLIRLAGRQMPASHLYSRHNRLRLICKPFGFEGMVDAAFNMIRQNSQTVTAVSIRLLESITKVAAQTVREADRAVLLRHAAMVINGCRASITDEGDLRDLEERYQAAVQRLSGAAALPPVSAEPG